VARRQIRAFRYPGIAKEAAEADAGKTPWGMSGTDFTTVRPIKSFGEKGLGTVSRGDGAY
jgi:hypothetical protein